MLALLSLLAPITIVGVLSESGALSCQNGEERWVGSWHDVGWSPVYGVPKSSGAEGTLVVVTGTPTTAPALRVENDFTCPPLQMRSDWIRTRSGIRYDRADKAPRHTLKVTDMRPFKGLSAAYSPTTDRITIQLTNPFDQPLTDVAVVLHYEGCYGKPNGFSRRHALGTLAPGATRPVDADARIMRPGPRGAEHTQSEGGAPGRLEQPSSPATTVGSASPPSASPSTSASAASASASFMGSQGMSITAASGATCASSAMDASSSAASGTRASSSTNASSSSAF